MPYSTEVADLVANQLSRFVTLNRHQLAGQVANLDFWLAEVRHALAVIDSYGERFVRLNAGQEHYVATHGTTVSEVGPVGAEKRRPPPPRRIPDRELQKARRNLTESAISFFERCRKDYLITNGRFTTALREIGVESN